MPRPRERVCLQDGLKLDLNRLARKEFIKHGANIGVRGIRWTHSYWGGIASGNISADMSGKDEGWFRIQLGSLINGSFSFRAPDISVVGNGISCARSETVPSRCFGSQMARRDSALGRPGAGKSLTNPNSTTPRVGLTLERRGSSLS
jgi:hypothetical protein